MKHKLEAMCLSVTNMDKMVEFYSNVFGIEFKAEDVADQKMYTGTFSGLEFTLVPAELTKVTAKDSRVHYDVYIEDIQEGIDLAEKHGGRTNGKLGESETEKAIGIFDPDDNFMVFKQRK